MIYMIITLFVIAVIEFSIYLILEFMTMRNNKNQKLNDDDKLYNDGSRILCGNSEDSGESNKDERKTETTSTQL